MIDPISCFFCLDQMLRPQSRELRQQPNTVSFMQWNLFSNTFAGIQIQQVGFSVCREWDDGGSHKSVKSSSPLSKFESHLLRFQKWKVFLSSLLSFLSVHNIDGRSPPIMRLLNHVTKVAGRHRTGCSRERLDVCLGLC